MAFSVARVAGAGLRRAATPAVVSSSASGLFGKTCFRPSIRLSDVPFQKTENHFDGWTSDELVWARHIIDSKIKQKGLSVIATERDARMEAMFAAMSAQQAQQNVVLTSILNKKGDITSIKVGRFGTVNMLSVAMVLLKIDENCPLLPMIQALIEKIQG